MQGSTQLGKAPRGTGPVFPVGQMLPFVLVTAIFFLWGMSNNLTDILVQQFRKSFELSLLEAQLVQTAVFLAYGTMAIPAALLMKRRGYKAGILTGLLVFGTGTLLFWPAAVVGRYAPFLLALFIVGCGSSILETACNPFIAEFGDAGTSERRLNFAQAFNPPGTILGVLVGTWFIFSGVEKTPAQVAEMKAAGTYAGYLHGELMRVVPTYLGLAAVLFLMALLVWRQRFPQMRSEQDAGPSAAAASGGGLRVLRQNPHLALAVVAQFFYIGAQVATWSTFIPYMKAYTAESERACGYFLTGNLVALAVGRVISTALMRYVSAGTLMRTYALINLPLLGFAAFHPGMAGAMAILTTSFFMSIIYPTIFALGVKGLGADTKVGSSLLVMAVLGGALFPPLMGVVKNLTGSLAMGYLLPAVGYVVVAAFGFWDAGPVDVAEVEAAPVL